MIDNYEAHVETVIINTLAKAERKWPDKNFHIPIIKYDINGRMSGQIIYTQPINTIRLNYNVMKANWGKFDQTIIHEIAHLITRIVFGPYAQGHGREWKYVMRFLDVTPQRCSNYELPEETKQNRIPYQCSKCKEIIYVSKLIHKRISNEGQRRIHMPCRQPIFPVIPESTFITNLSSIKF